MLNIATLRKYNPYILTFLVSLIFSYLAVITDNLLNHDGIYFMNAANAYLQDGFAAMLNAFPWPFFSWLVANLHQIFWFPHIEQTGHFINAIFTAITCILFVRIYAEITNNEGSLWVAAILVLTLVGLNKYRADLMKDFGYWCFYLAGFYCLLRYYKKPNWMAAIGWQLFMGLAFLFRIEGLVIIVLGPLAVFIGSVSYKERIVQVVRLYSVYIVGLVVLLTVMLFVDVSSIDVQLGRLSLIASYFSFDPWINAYGVAIKNLGGFYTYEWAHHKHEHVLAIVYASSLLVYIFIKIAECVGFPYFVIFLYGVFKKHISINNYTKITLYFILFLFLFYVGYKSSGEIKVVSSRYTTPLVFLLLLLIGQIVERILPAVSSSRYRKKIVAVVFLFLFLNTTDSVISTQGDSKTHVLQAGYWVEENTDHSVPVYSNYYKSIYYAGRGQELEFEKLIAKIENGALGLNAYVIVKIDQEEDEEYTKILDGLSSDKKIEYLKNFTNDEGDRSVIYRLVGQ